MNDASRGEAAPLTTGADDPRARALAHLQGIAERALATNRGRVAELDEALGLAVHGGLTDLRRQLAVDTAHQLVGSAGTFGYHHVSDVARRVERFFKEGVAGDEASIRVATDELRQIRQELDRGPDDDLDSD
ncbi:MAG: Hpt domain-containing protein [Propionibacteriaceae bacterium]